MEVKELLKKYDELNKLYEETRDFSYLVEMQGLMMKIEKIENNNFKF